MTVSRLLAIDPGTEQSAWVIFNEDNTIHSAGISKNIDVLNSVRLWMDELAIEMIASYGMPVGAEIFRTVWWIGRFAQAYRCPESVREVFRREVKLHLCGSTSATDANIMHAIQDMYPHTGGGKNPVKGTKSQPGPLFGFHDDMWAALGVALTVRGIQQHGLTSMGIHNNVSV